MTAEIAWAPDKKDSQRHIHWDTVQIHIVIPQVLAIGSIVLFCVFKEVSRSVQCPGQDQVN